MIKKYNIYNILNILRPYKRNIVWISLLMLITAIGSFLTPWLTKSLIDEGIINNEYRKVIFYVGVIIAVFFIQQIFEILQFHFYSKICIRIPYDLNLKACKQVLTVKIKYFKERNFSEVLSEIFQDIATISSIADSQFLASVVNLIKILAGIIALFLISWKLTILLLLVIPIRVLISRFMYISQRNKFKELMDNQSKFSSWLGDGISGIVEIKLWGLIKEKMIEVEKILSKFSITKKRLLFLGQIDKISNGFLSIGFNCLIYLVGASLIIKNEMTLGGLFSFVSYSALVMEPIIIMSYISTQLSSIIPAYERFSTFLQTDKEEDNEYAIEFKDTQVYKMSFENISLAYSNEYVLSDISFDIFKGEKVAIIGANGSGKTSLINLLLRFYAPTTGTIKINDKKIEELTLESYRKLFNLMAQSNYLFNDSIYNNINLTGELSWEEIKAACVEAEAYNFINNLPEDFNARVGYNGAKLSGGEKQKIALARTLAKRNSRILILDEATSNYDYKSEAEFNDKVMLSKQYDIIIMITHRPEILKKINKIIYLDKGKVIAVGNYDSLYRDYESFRNTILKEN